MNVKSITEEINVSNSDLRCELVVRYIIIKTT